MKKHNSLIIGIGMTLASAAPAFANATFDANRTDFRDETIYFAITTRFYDGDPTNNVLCWDGQEGQIQNNDPCWRGDFKGLIDRLDYIKALGFTAIWITPVVQNTSGYDYHGYHASDFSKVDLRYESRKEWGASQDVKFEDLINAAHAKGIKVILDIVLNHSGNFGEEFFAKTFTRNQNIKNQSTPQGSLIPDESKLGQNYWDNDEKTQYALRFKYQKNTTGENFDNHNYYHHIGGGWNWDEPNRWWGQIAGDCVDLNTENPMVADYLIKCYGEFIKMGVDGFRIDTSGHIARLSFNSLYIPAFKKLGEEYAHKRLNGAPFFMFGEVCARYSGAVYRDQDNLSPFFYTWKSDPALVNEFKTYGADYWNSQVLMEGCDPCGNMLLCEKETTRTGTSDNVFMKEANGVDAWHTPDYSQYSDFSVIDFTAHWNFQNAGGVINVARNSDDLYNDASYNVVYVDSHDYGPDSFDRFNGGTQQWAENLNLMFTFRGIPCLYYGSEVEFQAGKIIDKGTLVPLAETGRAYFGEYLKGEVSATDFGEFSASGNVNTTLRGALSDHIRNLNRIRQAVPALRKGQYTFSNCSANGGYAFKRAYKDNVALVAINGGATFNKISNGNYIDVVTGETYNVTNNSLTVNAPSNQGQLRVVVYNPNGEYKKVATDGKFIYTSAPVTPEGMVAEKPSFTDSGTTQYYGPEDVVGNAGMDLSPKGCKFTTETLTVTASLNTEAVSGWYQIDNGNKVNVKKGENATFTIGSGNDYGDQIVVKYAATGSDGVEYAGQATYTKADPNATITIYVKSNTAPNIYAWTEAGDKLNGAWPGNKVTATKNVEGTDYYYITFTEDSVNVIFNNNGGSKTADITDITKDTYFTWDGGTGYSIVNPGNVEPEIPVDPEEGYTLYFDDKNSNWNNIKMYVFGNGFDNYLGSWNDAPLMKFDPSTGYYKYTFSLKNATDDLSNSQVIFHNGSGKQTGDGAKIYNNGIYRFMGDGKPAWTGEYVVETGVNTLYSSTDGISVRASHGVLYVTSDHCGTITIVRTDGTYTVRPVTEGINVIDDLAKGLYIVNKTKVVL